jgi:hypothetical protein
LPVEVRVNSKKDANSSTIVDNGHQKAVSGKKQHGPGTKTFKHEHDRNK